MTGQERIWGVAGVGLVTFVLLALGVDTLGSILALFQLCLLVGAPTALQLADALRSRAAVVVLSVALSIAITALAVQSLVWFHLAISELIVLTSTAYGIVIAVLLDADTWPGLRGRSADGGDLW